MKKLLFFIPALVLWSCTEEGPSVTVPAVSSFQFSVSRNAVNSSADLEAEVEKQVNPVQLFNESKSQVRSIELIDFVAAIGNYNNTGEEEQMTLILETLIDGGRTEVARVEELLLENQGRIVLFEDGNPQSVLSSAQVGSLEAILDNYEPFTLVLTAQLNKTIDSNFTIEISWNVNLIVSQD